MKRILTPISHVLAYLIAVVIVTMAVMGLTKLFVGDWESGDTRTEILGDGLLTTLGIVITNLAFWLLRSKDVARGWPGVKTGLVWFAKGGTCGLFMAGLMVLLTIAFGGATLSFEQGALAAYVRYIIPLAGCLLIAALGEEWLFRGFPLTKLADVLGPGWANLLMSLLFAAAHLGSAGSNALALVNIVIGSAVVGSLRFTPGAFRRPGGSTSRGTAHRCLSELIYQWRASTYQAWVSLNRARQWCPAELSVPRPTSGRPFRPHWFSCSFSGSSAARALTTSHSPWGGSGGFSPAARRRHAVCSEEHTSRRHRRG